MAKNIELMGAVFPDVPSIKLPQYGGGLVSFDDTSDADAVAEDITQGKTAYVNGVKVVGTNQGGGGGYTIDEFLQRSMSGDIDVNSATVAYEYSFARSAITSISSESLRTGYNNLFYNCDSLKSVYLPNINAASSNAASAWFEGCVELEGIKLPSLTQMWNYFFNRCIKLKTVVLPKLNNSRANNFNNCTALKTIDIGNKAQNGMTLTANFWKGLTALDTVILRYKSICGLANISVFENTPFASGGSGGTVYVPSSLISSYQSATNWSTILGYANNSIQAIDGSPYESSYADGTPIS